MSQDYSLGTHIDYHQIDLHVSQIWDKNDMIPREDCPITMQASVVRGVGGGVGESMGNPNTNGYGMNSLRSTGLG